jgi:acetoin utilization deacetylase AcuC-like enzyme
VRTAYISHPDCLQHDTGIGHPECAARIGAIQDRLITAHLYDFLRHYDAPQVTEQQLLRVHDADYLQSVVDSVPRDGLYYLDPDTPISPLSLIAAKRAAGAAVLATDLVMSGEVSNAFCAVRPPGHHAERHRTMGFCVYNNIAVGVAHALEAHGLERVAILDFDVHHGNGNEQIFAADERVLVCSSFQHPFYPETPIDEENERIVCATLEATAKSEEFRSAIEGVWLPALNQFKPQMIFISAGFDAHLEDDMSGVSLTEMDFRWITEKILELADTYSEGRVVSSLEGGYELSALARSVEAHLRVLMNLH